MHVFFLLSGLMLVLPTMAGAQESRPQQHVRSPEQLATLIRQLGDDSFAVREQASKAILARGLQAEPALLKGTRDRNPEIRSRCLRLLELVRQRARTTRIEAFLAKKNDTPLPGWTRFQEVTGAAGIDRASYARLYEQEHSLLDSLEKDSTTRSRQIQSYCKALIASFIRSPKAWRLEKCKVLFLVATDRKSALDPRTYEAVARCLQTLTRWTKVRKAVLKDQVTTQLFLDFLKLGLNPARANAMVGLASQVELKESLPLLARLSSNKNNPVLTRAKAIQVVGKLGNKGHLPSLESLFTDTTLVGKKKVRGKMLTTQLRDVALAMAVHLNGQDASDFGFPYLQVVPGQQFTVSPICLGFDRNEERMKAFALWKRSGSAPAKPASPKPSKDNR